MPRSDATRETVLRIVASEDVEPGDDPVSFESTAVPLDRAVRRLCRPPCEP